MATDKEIEAAAREIFVWEADTREPLWIAIDEQGRVAYKLVAKAALAAAEQVRASEVSECERRARQIIQDENRMSETDDKQDIVLHALRWARYGTAKQILGEWPYGPLPPMADRILD